ncbi:hypothetical protein [Actinomadura decatromicini]|uniref:Uncharacterized protein n=1 Tax=Actinomadura decatromicini TaxID=2604572 RepID=A0A5D3F9C6_9ACTN|nr:hypothetical protein [Actinomadura decatromicini]TYK44436.1 hypothetical protein FXF68_33740 [Actinomadura decatromicini]
MDDYPVKVGAMLFTMVDPHRGHEVAYNRWYERDHFYAGVMDGPHALAGGRWVAPRALKDLRFPAGSPFAEPLDAGSYLSVYWYLEGKVDAHTAWAGERVWWLYDNGRGFAERSHAHTGIYTFESARYADDDGVPIELALDHGYKGLAVIVAEPADGGTADDLRTHLEDGPATGLLAADGVDTVSSWTPRSGPTGNGGGSPMALGTTGGSAERVVQLVFLECDPRECWDAVRAYAKAVEAGGAGRVTFAAPFLPTIVGTDAYTDELW